MKTKSYPEIGTKVKYIRADQDGKIFEGKGIVQSIFVDPNKRLMVQVKDDDNIWNVDMFGIDYTAQTRKDYKALIKSVQEVTEEGNQKASEIVNEYNKRVEGLYTLYLGEPVQFDG